MTKSLLIWCAAAASAVVGSILLLVYNDFGLCYRNTFANSSTAGAMEYIDKGWLPEWIPATALNIQEAHNLDSNQIVMKFELPAEQIAELKIRSKKTSKDILVPDPCTVQWWDRRTLHRNIKNGTFPVYKRPHRRYKGDWYFTCDLTNVYLWHVPYASLTPYY